MYKKFIRLLALLTFAATASLANTHDKNIELQKRSGFFRFSFDNVKMPNNIQDTGLLGVDYFADLTPNIYGGVGIYGSVTGTQGGLFVLGIGGGLHQVLMPHWYGDAGLFLGGGGGRASLVGGGLMVRPHIGITYEWQTLRLGLHYSYITFPDGKIHSQQIGLDLDTPLDFYYLDSSDGKNTFLTADDIHLPFGKYLTVQRNDFALLIQAYRQRPGTKNNSGAVQDGTMGLVGAEIDHYMTEQIFWWLKAAGAFHGIPNGYMDVLGGLGYHWTLGPQGLALVPQFGIGAGGGGDVDTGGGFLVHPLLGIEYPLTSHFATRLNGGYLWAPKGELSAFTATGELLYHLDLATLADKPMYNTNNPFLTESWRINLLNQTYIHPQRVDSVRSPIQLIAVQFDQLFTPVFFLSYQAAFAYSGKHAGGYATGMLGGGLQTSKKFCNEHLQPFAEVLIGAGGGGGLALGGGALIEPVAGLHYALTQAIGLVASVSEVKALRHDLNTPAVNLGLTIRFDTLNRA